MALVFRGKTRCPICGEIHQSGEELFAFPGVNMTDDDPALILNDAAVHKTCLFERPDLAKAAFEHSELELFIRDHYPELHVET